MGVRGWGDSRDVCLTSELLVTDSALEAESDWNPGMYAFQGKARAKQGVRKGKLTAQNEDQVSFYFKDSRREESGQLFLDSTTIGVDCETERKRKRLIT